MSITRSICPRCGTALATSGGQSHCPSCGSRPGRSTGRQGQRPTRSSPGVKLLVIGGSALFLFLGVIMTGYCFTASLPDPQTQMSGDPLNPGDEEGDWRDILQDLRTLVAAPPTVLTPPGPGGGTPVTVGDLPRVNQVIDRGVNYLKKAYSGDRVTASRGTGTGAHALAGLTLLECGVPVNDPVLQSIQKTVRAGVPRLTQTYEIAIVVWFLDRLAQPQDRDLIRTLALRLIASQGPVGGWGYTCHLLSTQEERKILTLLQQNPLPYGQQAPPAQGGMAPGTTPRPTRSGGRAPAKPGRWEDLPALKFQPGQRLENQPKGHEDNSLTQFAILALWAAQKYQVPVERPLAMVEARFRTFQNQDGSWGYTLNSTTRRDSMTCAGLLGLAVGRGLGNANAPGKETRDEAIEKALIYLKDLVNRTPLAGGEADLAKKRAEYQALVAKLGTAKTNEERQMIQAELRKLQPFLGSTGRGRLIGADGWGDLYCLWSLERMAVVYDLKTVGGIDWYAWGSEIIIQAQKADGSWSDAFAGVPDTCFALLFLKRVNVVQDLTNKLRLLGKIKDPGQQAIPPQTPRP